MLRMIEHTISFSVAAVLAAMLLSAAPAWSGGNQGTKGAKQGITEAEAVNLQRQLFDALTAPDGHAMEALMADDMIFMHINAHTQTKAEFLSQAAEGKRGAIFEPQDTQVHIYDGAVVLSGKVDITSKMTGPDGTVQSRVFHTRISDVWAPRPAGWQLVLLQATSIPEPK
jgi:ketosteroid isomerase-like protein